MRDHPYLVPDPAVPPRRPADFGYVHTADLNEDVRNVQDRMEAAGLEVLVLGRPDAPTSYEQLNPYPLFF